MTLVEKMAQAIYRKFEDRPAYAQLQMNGHIATELAIAALEAMRPSEDMIEKIAAEMDVAMQMEFNCVFAVDVMKRMARAACFALVNEAILQQKQ